MLPADPAPEILWPCGIVSRVPAMQAVETYGITIWRGGPAVMLGVDQMPSIVLAEGLHGVPVFAGAGFALYVCPGCRQIGRIDFQRQRGRARVLMPGCGS